MVQPKPTTRPGNADPAKRSAKIHAELRGYPPAQNVKPVARPNAFSGTSGGKAGKRERQPQLESARETTKRTRASAKSSTAGAGGGEKAVIKGRAERLGRFWTKEWR